MITLLASGTLGINLINHLIKNLTNYGYDKINLITKKDKVGNRGYALKPTPIKEYLLKNDLINSVNLIEIDSFKKLEYDEKKIIENTLRNTEIAVVCDFGLIVPEELINLPKVFINIHPSLLPFYRGPSPIEYCLLNGDSITGVTICLLSKEVDAGKIIIQKIIKIDHQDNCLTLKNKISTQIPYIFDIFFKMFKESRMILIKQNENYATYTKKIDNEILKIDLNDDIIKIYNKIRAFYPETYIENIENDFQRIKILKANLSDLNIVKNLQNIRINPKYPFFRVLNKRLFLVNNKEQYLEIIYLQLPNKKPFQSIDFINGYFKK